MHALRTLTAVLAALLLAGCASLPNSGNYSSRSHTTGDYDDDNGGMAASGSRLAGSGTADAPESITSLMQPDDLWQRMRNGFSSQDATRIEVSRQVASYSSNPAQVEKVFQRAAPYLGYILGEVKQRGFPTSIALLPFVESGYDPFAYSSGRAAGLWQFIPDTGKLYGLEQNWWYDGRRDIVASTQAALDHLGALHDEFSGDWELALAAYNAGSGTINAAIERNHRLGKPVDFWHLDLPRETTEYVPRLLAIREIVRDPGRYGISLAPIEPAPAFSMVDIDGQIDLGVAASLAGMNTGDFLQLNPGFNRLSTRPDGTHQLAIPVEKLDRFVDRLDSLPDEQRTRNRHHTVQAGDTLSQVARRYGVTVASLQQANHLNGSAIRLGQDLLVSNISSAPNQLAILPQQRVAQRTAPVTTHTVSKGDNLWSIARKYQVSISELQSWNRLSGKSTIHAGQKLQIQGGKLASNDSRLVHYTVKRGDSLSVIARKYNVSVDDLRRWNKLPGSDHLVPGQRLELHVTVTEVAQN